MWGYLILILALDAPPVIEPAKSATQCADLAKDWAMQAREWRIRSGLPPGSSIAVCYPSEVRYTSH